MLHVSTASGYMGKWSDLVTHHRSMQNLMSNTLRNRTSCTVGRGDAPELELLAVVIVLFAPILHESLTNSNFVTNTI